MLCFNGTGSIGSNISMRTHHGGITRSPIKVYQDTSEYESIWWRFPGLCSMACLVKWVRCMSEIVKQILPNLHQIYSLRCPRVQGNIITWDKIYIYICVKPFGDSISSSKKTIPKLQNTHVPQKKHMSPRNLQQDPLNGPLNLSI